VSSSGRHRPHQRQTAAVSTRRRRPQFVEQHAQHLRGLKLKF
jgi:hypothetical protein